MPTDYSNPNSKLYSDEDSILASDLVRFDSSDDGESGNTDKSREKLKKRRKTGQGWLKQERRFTRAVRPGDTWVNSQGGKGSLDAVKLSQKQRKTSLMTYIDIDKIVTLLPRRASRGHMIPMFTENMLLKKLKWSTPEAMQLAQIRKFEAENVATAEFEGAQMTIPPKKDSTEESADSRKRNLTEKKPDGPDDREKNEEGVRGSQVRRSGMPAADLRQSTRNDVRNVRSSEAKLTKVEGAQITSPPKKDSTEKSADSRKRNLIKKKPDGPDETEKNEEGVRGSQVRRSGMPAADLRQSTRNDVRNVRSSEAKLTKVEGAQMTIPPKKDSTEESADSRKRNLTEKKPDRPDDREKNEEGVRGSQVRRSGMPAADLGKPEQNEVGHAHTSVIRKPTSVSRSSRRPRGSKNNLGIEKEMTELSPRKSISKPHEISFPPATAEVISEVLPIEKDATGSKSTRKDRGTIPTIIEPLEDGGKDESKDKIKSDKPLKDGFDKLKPPEADDLEASNTTAPELRTESSALETNTETDNDDYKKGWQKEKKLKGMPRVEFALTLPFIKEVPGGLPKGWAMVPVPIYENQRGLPGRGFKACNCPKVSGESASRPMTVIEEKVESPAS